MYKIKRTDYTNGIERDLMAAIVLAVKNNKTTEARVQEISIAYLKFVKEAQVEIMVQKFRELGQKYGEVRDVANKYWAKLVNDVRLIALSRTRVYLKNGNLDKALITVKGGTHYV